VLQVPAFIACLILTAHFLRWGNLIGVVFCLALPVAAVASKNRAVLRAWQFLLGLGCALWIYNAVVFGRERLASGEPWLRMALILGAVSLFTGVSAGLLSLPRVLERYR
jgi:hypothetical protein